MMPDLKTYKQHFENKHPKAVMPKELLGHHSFGMFVLKMLLVRFQIRHHGHANRALSCEGSSSSLFILRFAASGLFLELGRLLVGLHLRLDLLLSTRHL